jgi:hypothetical protein
MFISVIANYTKVGVVNLNFNVSKKYSVVGKFPNFFFRQLVCVLHSLGERREERAVEDVIVDDNVGDKHIWFTFYKNMV